MFQACEQNQAVRHGIVAIAAMDVTSLLTRGPCDASGADVSVPRDHYQFALQQYSLALRHMHSETTKGEQDLATTLVTIIIIVCFETFNGNIDSAFNQITTGLGLIEQAVENETLRRPSVDGIAPYTLPGVDEELIRAFARLDVQAGSFVKNRTIPGLSRKDFRLADLSSMPAHFRDMSEAKNYSEIIVTQFVHMSALAIQMAQKHGGMDSQKSGSMEKVHVMDLLEPSMSLGQARAHYMHLITQWHDAFVPILAHARTAAGGADFLAATILELKYQALRLSIDSIPVAGVPDMIDFMPYFEEIVSLGRQILEHTDVIHNKRLFTFESEVIIPLYVAGVKCAHSTTRREAIGLLSSSRRRENIWDGVVAAKLAEWIMNVEEEYLEGGYVPKEMRMIQMTADFDIAVRKVCVTGLMPTKPSGEIATVKANLSWK
jgi:hypothetical protein